MLDPHVSRFWQATLLSGLMSEERLKACWEGIAPPKRDALEHLDRRLARQAVQQKALTLWQAQQLLAGRTSGFKVDRYVLLDLIGQGGMGRVYLARDTRLERQVALKILSPERVNNPRAIARFQREARVGAQLQHENLVRIYDFGESNNRYYLVMEYIEGKTIGTLIAEQGHMPALTAVRLARQIAMGLEHAHRKGLIHRDVNPYNVLVTRDGTAKLADLGLAIDLADGEHVTRDGATVGTFDYVAPEQARHSHSADIRSDIYSLGCTLYHMCSGQVPFPSPSLPEKLFAHQALEPTPLEQLVEGLPPGLDEIICRMMRKSPDERFATPMQVIAALDPFVDENLTSEKPEQLSCFDELKTVGHIVVAPPFQPDPDNASPPPESKAGDGFVPAKLSIGNRPEHDNLPLTETASVGNSDDPTGRPFHSAPHEHQASDPDFPLFVAIDPEPLLTTEIVRKNPRTAVKRFIWSTGRSAGSTRAATLGLWGVVVISSTIVLLLGFMAVFRSFDGTVPKIPNQQTKRIVLEEAKPPKDLALNNSVTETAIVVRSDGEGERGFAAAKILEAMQTAMGARGWVELRNREPIRLTNKQRLDFSSGQGRLNIRSAPGVQPIIELDLMESQPLLTTGSGVSLEISGVTINVSYPNTDPSFVPPPLIASAGSAKFDRCAFQVKRPDRPPRSSAILSDGGVLEVTRCWFEGFDEAIRIKAMNRATSRLRQTMIVRQTKFEADESGAKDWYGWAVKLQLPAGLGASGKSSQRHVVLEHCTIDGAGLIDLSESSASSTAEIEVRSCVVKAAALLACKPEAALTSQISWHGKDNHYEISRPAWIVLSASTGTPALSTGATDHASWSQIAPNDQNPILEKLKFAVDASTRPNGAQPFAYRILNSIHSKVASGADPDVVGPWSSP
jgi:serine/threonine-protein kinase